MYRSTSSGKSKPTRKGGGGLESEWREKGEEGQKKRKEEWVDVGGELRRKIRESEKKTKKMEKEKKEKRVR